MLLYSSLFIFSIPIDELYKEENLIAFQNKHVFKIEHHTRRRKWNSAPAQVPHKCTCVEIHPKPNTIFYGPLDQIVNDILKTILILS